MTLRMILADDHAMLREGLRRAMHAAGFEVVAEAGGGDEAVRLTGEHRPDVVLMDVTMPGEDGGLGACRRLRATHPGVRVVMLTMHEDEELQALAREAGAAGYVVKDATTEELVAAVRRAAGPALTAVAAMPSFTGTILSPREVEVLRLVAEGLATSEVAARLCISQKTVKNHLAAVFEKLGSHDRTQAVVQALRLGIIELP